MPIVRPKNFPIRKIESDQQDTGLVYNQKRYTEHGGLSSASKIAGPNPFSVEAPEKGSKSGENSKQAPY